MAGPNIHQYATQPQDETRDTKRRLNIAGRESRRRWLLTSAVTASLVAAVAMAVGLPATGIAAYVVATLPFAFFS